MRTLTQLTQCVLIVLASAFVLGGCGSGKSPIGPMMAHRPPPVKKPLAKGPSPLTDMVAAVADSKTGSARVSVRFDLRGRPQVAQPMDLDLVILPAAGLDRVSGKIEAGEGLELVSGADIPPADRPAEDVPIPYSVRVVPRREGVLTLRTVISSESAGVPSTQTFSIPLIATASSDASAHSAQAAAATTP